MKFTREQSLALCQDRHLAVTANAGSGKTRVLVEKYVDIILKHDPRSVLAITFTRKAAAEMRQRVVQSIEELLKDEKNSKIWGDLLRIREKLTNAEISTIHSFCTKLLREFPIESGISPVFTELSESEISVILNDSILSVCEDWLSEDNPNLRDKALPLFKLFNQRKVEDYLKKLYYRRDAVEHAINLHDKYSIPEIVKIIKDSFFNTVVSGYIDDFTALSSLADNASAFEEKSININKITDYKLSLNNIINLLKDSVKSKDTGLLKKASIICGEIKPLKIGNTLIHNYLLKKCDNENLSSAITRSFDSLCNTGNPNEWFEDEQKLQENIRLLLEIFSDVLKEIELRKADAGGMDFEDMLIKARGLLRDPEIRGKLRNRYKHILIDEFQDTNPIQWEIARSMIESFEGGFTGSKLFIVGDEKQSIYGFRSADVNIFRSARKEIIDTNAGIIKDGLLSETLSTSFGSFNDCTNDEICGWIRLLESFRLAPVPASFINSVFSKIMIQGKSVYEIGYEPLVYAREFPAVEPGVSDFSSDEFGSIAVLLHINKKVTDDDDLSGESELLTRYIRNLVLKKEKTVFIKDEGLRQIQWSDIAVLVRSRNKLGALISEFIKYRIPYTLHSGSGFFNTQEIIDLRQFLIFLQNTGDDLATAAILKSPFFGLSDTTLFAIVSQKNHESIWKKLIAFSQADDESDTMPDESFSTNKLQVKRAVDILSGLLDLAGKISLSQLIYRILDDTGWFGSIVQSPSRRQHEANVGKLIDFARSYEQKGFKNLHDFIRELDVMSEASKEPEAAFVSGENTVNIMTIHSAKGLEFPIVALFDTSSSSRKYGDFYVDTELGVSFNMPAQIGVNGERGTLETPSLKILRQKEIAKSDAEEKRVFYVAATRAKEHLILSATISETDKGFGKAKGFFKLLLDGLKLNSQELIEKITNGTFSITTDLHYLKNQKVNSEKITFPVHFVLTKNQDEFTDEIKVQNLQMPALLLETIDSEAEGRIFSATQILTYLKNPDEYAMRYILGLPANDDVQFDALYPEPEKENDTSLGTFPGILIHAVMENINQWFADGVVNSVNLSDTIKKIVSDSDRVVSKELFERIFKESEAIAKTNLLRKFSNHISESKKEYKLTIPIGNDFLTGTLDLLIKNDSDEWEIWDWKTNRVENRQDIERLAQHYQPQMQFYAYFLSMIHPEQQHFIARLLFTRLAGSSKNTSDWTYTYDWSRDETGQFRQEFESVISNIKNLYSGK